MAKVAERPSDRLARWVIWIIIIAVAAGAMIFVMNYLIANAHAAGADQPAMLGEVRTRRLVIVDALGRERIMLDAEDGKPGVLLFDDKGKIRVMLSVNDRGPGLSLATPEGKLAVTLSARDQGAIFILSDLKGNQRIIAAVARDATGVQVVNEQGRTIWCAP